MRQRYTATIPLYHNEEAAAINLETGALRTLPKKTNNIPEGKEVFEPQGIFKKDYSYSWEFLY